MTVNPHQAMRWATVAAVLFAVCYLLATYRRGRRAAIIGLAGAVLFGSAMVGFLAGVWHEQVLEVAGMADGPTRRVTALWLHSAHMTLAHGLMIWAVVTDRPPPADE